MCQIRNLVFLATWLTVTTASVNDACNGRCDSDKTTYCNVVPKVCEPCTIYCDPSSRFGTKENCNKYCPDQTFPTPFTPTEEVTESFNFTTATTDINVKVSPKSRHNKTLIVSLCVGLSSFVALICLAVYGLCKFRHRKFAYPVQETTKYSVQATTDKPIPVTSV